MKLKNLIQGVVIGSTAIVSIGSANSAEVGTTAVAVCSASTATAMTSGGYIKASFTPKCSANTIVYAISDAADSTATKVNVKGASAKGKTYYGGSTDTGAAGVCGEIAAADDTAAEIAAKVDDVSAANPCS